VSRDAYAKIAAAWQILPGKIAGFDPFPACEDARSPASRRMRYFSPSFLPIRAGMTFASDSALMPRSRPDGSGRASVLCIV
jgi:hypothetical protein